MISDDCQGTRNTEGATSCVSCERAFACVRGEEGGGSYINVFLCSVCLYVVYIVELFLFITISISFYNAILLCIYVEGVIRVCTYRWGLYVCVCLKANGCV